MFGDISAYTNAIFRGLEIAVLISDSTHASDVKSRTKRQNCKPLQIRSVLIDSRLLARLSGG